MWRLFQAMFWGTGSINEVVRSKHAPETSLTGQTKTLSWHLGARISGVLKKNTRTHKASAKRKAAHTNQRKTIFETQRSWRGYLNFKWETISNSGLRHIEYDNEQFLNQRIVEFFDLQVCKCACLVGRFPYHSCNFPHLFTDFSVFLKSSLDHSEND